MTFYTTCTDDEYIDKLTIAIKLITVVVDQDNRQLSVTNSDTQRNLLKNYPRRPTKKDLPDGYCTFSYECNNLVKHWRLDKQHGVWMPVCGSHRAHR